jgi:hypothetical protein
MLPIIEKLKAADESLYNALEASKQVVNDSFFPKMAVSYDKDSLNSFPHIRDLEIYLNEILGSHDDIFNPSSPVYISSQELYIILASILFHDIGRTISNKSHGKHSKDIILAKDGYGFLRLKIPSKELAEAIGFICEYHEPENIADCRLNSILTDKGLIRVRELAALLVLLDDMDSTYRRLAPLFVTGKEERTDSVAAFRDIIRGIKLDEKRKAVIVAIDNDFYSSNELKEKKNGDTKDKRLPNPDQWNNKYLINDELLDDNNQFDRTKIMKVLSDNELKFKYNLDDIIGLFDKTFLYSTIELINETTSDRTKEIVKDSFKKKDYAIKELSNKELKKILDISPLFDVPADENEKQFKHIFYQFGTTNNKKSDEIENPFQIKSLITLLMNDIIRVTIPLENKKNKWPAIVLISLVISSLKKSYADLKYKCNFLQRLGLPVNSWLILYNDRLYNCYGRETYEPIFTKHYLIDVAECMWKLSTRVFGQTFFSYQTLASAMVEPDLEKIKLAVERISIITREEKPVKTWIWSDKDGWRWIKEEVILLEDNPEYLKTDLTKHIVYNRSKISEKKKELKSIIGLGIKTKKEKKELMKLIKIMGEKEKEITKLNTEMQETARSLERLKVVEKAMNELGAEKSGSGHTSKRLNEIKIKFKKEKLKLNKKIKDKKLKLSKIKPKNSKYNSKESECKRINEIETVLSKINDEKLTLEKKIFVLNIEQKETEQAVNSFNTNNGYIGKIKNCNFLHFEEVKEIIRNKIDQPVI